MANTPRRKNDLTLISLFIAFLSVGLFDVFLDLDPAPRQSKHQAALPSFPSTRKQLVSFPGELKLYCSFHAGLQDSLLLAHGSLKYFVFNTSPNNEVILGEGDWLYMNREGSIDYYRNLYPYSDEDKSKWRTELQRRRDHAAKVEAFYLLTIAPNKHTVYPEFMPPTFKKRSHHSRLDELSELIADIEPPLPLVDLKSALLEAKKEVRIYHKTDTHWNSLGAAIASREIVDSLRIRFPQLARDQFAIDQPGSVPLESGGDLARLIGLKYQLFETDIRPLYRTPRRQVVDSEGQPIEFRTIDIRFRDRFETRCEKGEITHAIVFLDSFGVIMIPYLAPFFQRAEFYWQDDYDAELVEASKPDVIIQQVVERKLLQPPPTVR